MRRSANSADLLFIHILPLARINFTMKKSAARRTAKGDVDMNFEFKKEELSSLKCAFSSAAEQSVDFELNLPDYCSDIKRILKCNVLAFVNSLRRTGNTVTASGEIVVRLVYVGADEKIDCYEQKSELSKTCELKDLPENAVLTCNCDTEYINCRAASQRRFSVNGSVSVVFKGYCLEKTGLISQIEQSGAQTLREEAEVSNVIAVGEKCFDMSETASLEQDKEPIGKIIRSDAFASLESAKAVSGKLLVKGEFVTEVVYCADSSDGKTQTLRHSMPISQIIELPDISENSECTVSLSVRSLSLQPRSDSSGSNRLLEIAAKVCAFVKATEEKKIGVVTDCYSTRCALKGEYSFVELNKKVCNFDVNETFQKTVELSGQSAKSIIDARCVKTSCSVTASGEKAELHLDILAGIIFSDNDGNVQYAEKNLTFTTERRAKEKITKIGCEPLVTIERTEGTALGGEKIRLSFFVRGNFDVFSAEQKRICMAASEDENSKMPENGALIIYYSKKGEKLWDIAKRYGSTLKAISEENEVSGDTLEDDKMLMIPCV